MALAKFGELFVDVFTVAGVVWPYIPQGISIWKTKESESFSLLTSLVVIISATTRCYYWIEKQYPLPLFIQAIASVLAQLGMVFVVVRTRQHNKLEAVRQGKATRASLANKKTFADLDWSSFWAWDDFASFLQFEALFILTLMLFQAAFGSFYWYVELQGIMALGIEALLPVPQAIKNYKTKNTHGLSAILIGSWAVGDAFKVFYAVAKEAPAPFILCGAFQFCVDLVVAAQLFWCYRDKKQPGRQSDADTLELTATAGASSSAAIASGSSSSAQPMASPRSAQVLSIDSSAGSPPRLSGAGAALAFANSNGSSGGEDSESSSLIPPTSATAGVAASSGVASLGSRTSSRSGKRFASTSSNEDNAPK
jgi:solute carrier family 66, member 2